MMGWVGSGEDFCGLGWVGSRNFGLGWVLKKVTHDQLWGIHKHKYYTVTLKSRLSVTQGHWKRNHWIDHTRLSSSRVI